ncbi:Ninjurin-1-like protein [Leptotrombidium deliense]|uniref:Ninjurin-1-like protein n=1 Tax=Leptotrombidium deliense TaxID=299467 RepID=A0A443SJ60_9ACAR|nr:Ninjurin-1-like protein [Leptotrombidium deliense]
MSSGTQLLNASKMKQGSNENKEAYKLDYSLYATKKNISQGLLDIAVLTANTTQLKTVLQRGTGDGSQGLYIYIVNLSLIGTSIALQIIVGIILLLNSRQNINDVKVKNKAESCNSVILLIAFIITIVNVFIVVFLDS